MTDLLKPIIAKAAEGPLSRAEAETAFNLLFDGEATPSQIGGLLMALRTRGEVVDEFAAAAAVMRAKCNKVSAPDDAIDIVGTGGDGKKTLNISTAAAFVVAGAGFTVAKHGNRNLSSKSGSADALEMSGVKVMVPADMAQSAINEIGIGFMMAPMHHPAVKHVMPTRVELGTRTIFNILGPLTNPAGVKRQLTGAFNTQMLRPMAETLLALGSTSAWLVHGSDGTDEIAISGPTHVVAVENGAIREFDISPEDAGLERHDFSKIIGGEPAHNAKAMADLFDGTPSAYRDAVLLNAAAAIHVATDGATDLPSAAHLAAQSIDSGAAKAKLSALAKFTSEA